MSNFLILCVTSFAIGALPVIGILFFLFTQRRLSQLGTGNISVSAAFYHGGTLIGILAVISEALKGIAAVTLARSLFPTHPVLPLVALCCLVLGRFLIGKGAGTTNMVWGIVAYQWRVAFFLLLISGSFFLFDRDRNRNKYLVLLLLPLIIAFLTKDVGPTLMAMVLGGLLGLIYLKIGDDLGLDTQGAHHSAMFHFLKGTPSQPSLDQRLDPTKVGEKAANLSYLKREGYNVPAGWVLLAGDDPEQFAAKFIPSPEDPLVARSSAVGEDSLEASAAGQYETVLNVTSPRLLLAAIARCQDSFDNPNAVQYRHNHNIQDSSMAVLVQPQIQGVYSGVVFSRDPLESWLDQVVIEAVKGQGHQLVSGQTTPQRSVVSFARVKKGDRPSTQDIRSGDQDLPESLILEIACLARQLEDTFQGIPQDIEWTYDGQQLWVLQSRPITTLVPIWTRKIAAEVIPGLIHPLTWSINQPLTCGVWGNLFQLVLGQRQSADLDFQQTATLHFGRAYFNASLLGQIFIRMGLPPESLEFLTQGAKMSPPKGLNMLKSLPGLSRLIGQELKLARQFKQYRQSQHHHVLSVTDLAQLNDLELWEQIESTLKALEKATYFQIMAPLSFAVRQKLFRMQPEQLDTTKLPEVASMKAIATLAQKIPDAVESSPQAVLRHLESHLKDDWQDFLHSFGYLSEVATDISVPTWQEQPEIVARSIQLLRGSSQNKPTVPRPQKAPPRLQLKGHAAQIYNRLLAHLRYAFLALEQRWIHQGWLHQSGDIFFLEWSDIKAAIDSPQAHIAQDLLKKIKRRKTIFQSLKQMDDVPSVIYGKTPDTMPSQATEAYHHMHMSVMEGIGASAGQVEGAITLVNSLTEIPAQITPEMILVVPFTDAGWAPIFANAGGIISEVGGKLSHGAILAREYGIPAVMDVKSACKRLHNGQKVRIDGLSGRVEILSQ